MCCVAVQKLLPRLLILRLLLLFHNRVHHGVHLVRQPLAAAHSAPRRLHFIDDVVLQDGLDLRATGTWASGFLQGAHTCTQKLL